VENVGVIEVASPDKASLDRAVEWIKGIVEEPEVGKTYEGTVKSIQDFGAFVEFLPGKEGLLHISEISYDRLASMEGVYEPGQKIDVKLLEVDQRSGKFRLSHKALLPKPEGYVEPQRMCGGGGGRDRDRGPRRDDRGGNRDRGGFRGDRRDDRGPRRDYNDRGPRNDGGNREHNNED
jgi:polyribonucleotide nucleotidyltransferase